MRALLAVAVLVVAGCAAVPPPATPPPTPEPEPLPVLVRSVQVDATRWSGEPSILALEDGTLLITGAGGMTRYAEDPTDAPGNAGQSYIWRSTDGGANWTFVDLEAGPADPVVPYRSGVFGVEGDLAGDLHGQAYFVDLTMLATQGVAVSTDGGASWANPGSPVAGLLPGTDRPWIAADTIGAESRSVVVKYLQLAAGHRLAYLVAAPAGTLAMVEDRAIPSCGQTPILIERTGPGATEARVAMACNDGGLSLLRAPAYFGPAAGPEFPVERIDGPANATAAGGGIGAVLAAARRHDFPMANVYALAWEDVASGLAVKLSVSADDGATWSTPLRLNRANTSAVQPWADLGDNGTLAVTWYESPGEEDVPQGPWVPMHAYLRVAPDGTFTEPVLTELSDHPVHEGPICMDGLGCVLDGRAKERRLLDFFEVDVDDAGTSHVTWTDNSGDFPTIWYGQVAPPADA